MPNLRIISDNALDRAASFTATNTNASYPTSNMLNDDKSSTWRTNGTGFTTLTATWGTPEAIGAVIFPFCNFSPTAIGKIRISTELATLNRVLYSEQFDSAVWQKTGGSVTANAFSAPDGQATGDKFLSSTSDAYLFQTIPGTAGQIYVFSVWLKSNTNRNIPIYLYDSGPTALAITTTWKRFWVSAVATSGGSQVAIIGGNVSLSSGAEVHMWGAQVEAGTVPTSYYPTTAGAAVRPAGYIDNWQFYQYDSGNVLICPAPAIKLRGFTAAQAAGAYAYGGGACARMWFPAFAATGIRIDLDVKTRLVIYAF